MIVLCPHCSSRYDVDATLFGGAPRTVKCSECGWQWLHLPASDDVRAAHKPDADAAPVAAPDDGDKGLNFGDAMNAAQQAIAEAAKNDALASEPPAGSADTRPRTDGRQDGKATPIRGAASDAGSVAQANAQANAEANGGAEAAADASSEDDFEIELGSEDEEAAAVSPEPSPPSPPLRVPRWVVGASAAAATIAVLAVVLLLGRNVVLDAIPESAGVYRLFGFSVDAIGAGLEIGDVASSREWSDGEEMLIVSGQITNTTNGPMPVPPLKVALYSDADQLLQSVTVPAAGKVLLAGESTEFRARVPRPPEAAQRIKITFDSAEHAGS